MGGWDEDVSSTISFTCLQWSLPSHYSKVLFVYLYLSVRLHLFPMRGFDKGLSLLDAKLGKESISGESAHVHVARTRRLRHLQLNLLNNFA